MTKKETLRIIIAALAVLVAVLIGFGTWFLSGTGSTYYYTQIDNSSRKESDSEEGVINLTGDGGLTYSYTLTAYNEKGHEKEVTFGASKELREGAFICLQVMPVRGVLNWSEIQYDELPDAVQNCYTPSENT